jgi:hypothetical protein
MMGLPRPVEHPRAPDRDGDRRGDPNRSGEEKARESGRLLHPGADQPSIRDDDDVEVDRPPDRRQLQQHGQPPEEDDDEDGNVP